LRWILRAALFAAFLILSGAQEVWAQEKQDKFLGLLEWGALCAPVYGCSRPGLSEELWLYESATSTKPVHGSVLPEAEEYDYETPGFVVYEINNERYKVKSDERYFWVSAADAGIFHSYPLILRDQLTYIEDGDSRLYKNPDMHSEIITYKRSAGVGNEIPAEIHSITEINGQWWIEISVQDSICTGDQPAVIARGWVPAWNPDTGARALWFYSRGC